MRLLNRRIATLALGLFVSVAACVPSAAGDAPKVRTWTVDGAPRRAIVYSPTAKSPDGAAPLVLSFHGHGDNIVNFQLTNMHRAWPEAIVVYVQGLPSRRDRLAGWQTQKGQDEDRDLKLVDAVLASIRAEFKVDDRRIYATGFSNGAMFTYLLWAERPDVFAAFAPVAARLPASVLPRTPRPLFHVAGERDETILIADQEEAIAAARRVNSAADRGLPCGDGCRVYGHDTAAPVMTWIHPGGHEYPPDTAAKIAAFFRDHPLAR